MSRRGRGRRLSDRELEHGEMVFTFRQWVPLAFLLTSVAYIAFVFSLEEATMIGDNFAYDPGGRIVPLLAAMVLCAASLRLVVHERASAHEESDRATRYLVLANIGLSALFIVLFRPLGFVATTGLMMFWFIYLNLRATETGASMRTALPWLAVTMVYLVFLYSVSRGVVKGLFALARTYQQDLFREPFLQAIAVLAILIPLIVMVGMGLRRLPCGRVFAIASQTTVGTTMAIYVVFRQLFLVQLPQGVLSW